MKLVTRYKELGSRPGVAPKRRVILHHTVTPTVQSAVNALQNRGLAYHYMIDKDGTVYEFVPPNRMAYHAAGYNMGSIGIAFICGGKYGETNNKQIDACVSLLKILKQDFKFLDKFTGHKHASRSGKIDPRWKGEPELGIDWKIDKKYMLDIEKRTGLRAEFIKGVK